ncbi:hypothetical protein KDW55_14180 [Burkholderia sp. AU19243]|nr:hypothetical protein [Burkholderia sp. AU19243]
MNHLHRLSRAAALACALSVSAVDACASDTLVDRSRSANVFRSERRALAPDDWHTVKNSTRPIQYAAPVERSDSAWPPNRVELGAGGRDSFGRALPRHEQRELNWNEYLRANGSHAHGGGNSYAPTRPFEPARGPRSTPNPYDPSVPQPETRTFYDDGAGSHCTATGGAGTARSSCHIAW